MKTRETRIRLNTARYENENGVIEYVLHIHRDGLEAEIWIKKDTYDNINKIIMAEYNEKNNDTWKSK